MKNGTLLAAIDLGSNSFRLEICRFNNGILHRSEYIKEAVRQGSGLDEDRNLSASSMEKGWECLSRFAERLAGFHSSQVRAVATACVVAGFDGRSDADFGVDTRRDHGDRGHIHGRAHVAAV